MQRSAALSRAYANTVDKARSYASEAEARYDGTGNALDKLANAGVPRDAGDAGTDIWSQDALFYIKSFKGLDSVAWVDPAFRVQKVVPARGDVVGANANDVTWGPSDVKLWVPVYDGVGLKGFILGVINVDTFLSPVVTDMQDQYMLQLSNEGTPVFTSTNWIDPGALLTAVRTVTLRNAEVWSLSLAPTQKLLAAAVAEARRTLQFSLLLSVMTTLAACFALNFNALSRLNESRFRRTLESMAEGCLIIGPDWRYIFANDTAASQYGRSREDLLGHKVDEYFPDIDTTDQFRLMQRCMRERKPQHVLDHVTLPDGTSHWYEVSIQPAPDGILLLSGDITERRQAEEEREVIQEQLHQSQKLEAIGQLAGGVAHDFNNLLTGILGNVAIIRGDLPASDPLVANLLAVETAARQAADLAKGLLTFSRRAVVAAVPLDMTGAVEMTLTMLRQSLPATMSIVRDVEPTTWSVLADRSQITQVILNLAVNARDAMQGKGTLTIRTRNEVVGPEYVQDHPLARIGEFVHLSVADTGPGIPAEIREHLFEPFRTTKPAGSGTGLGLSIVYGAVKQAGGWVTADSPAGGGTSFDIFLPRCLSRAEPIRKPGPAVEYALHETILVVEDEPVVSAVAQALLTRSGCTVLTAGDGASALEAVRKHPGTIDLILLDMSMPGMTTQEIVPALRALNPAVPILLNSGYTSSDTVKQMLEEGTVQGFLGKPYEPHQLLHTIAQLLQTTEWGPR
jgi:PAS domain S-box-containing protein